MKTARMAVSVVGMFLIGGGYFASQYMFFLGDPAKYVKAIESSSVPVLALILLLLAVALAFVPDKESEA